MPENLVDVNLLFEILFRRGRAFHHYKGTGPEGGAALAVQSDIYRIGIGARS